MTRNIMSGRRKRITAIKEKISRKSVIRRKRKKGTKTTIALRPMIMAIKEKIRKKLVIQIKRRKETKTRIALLPRIRKRPRKIRMKKDDSLPNGLSSYEVHI